MDDIGSAIYASFRYPLLRFTERLEKFDNDPEVRSLELPPEQVFGPLPLKQQLFITLQALEEENELADHYLTRLVIDHIDLGLEPSPLGSAFLDAGGDALCREAVRRFRDLSHQRIKFFTADRFIRFLSIALPHAPIAREYLKEKDAIDLLFRALHDRVDPYIPHLATRLLVLLALHQPTDGEVERRVLQNPQAVPALVDYLNTCSGDPQDTRYVFMLLSALARSHPTLASAPFRTHHVLEAVFHNMNLAMHKGLSQHLRVLGDMEQLDPRGVEAHMAQSNDPLTVLLGVTNTFKSYAEIQTPLCRWLRRGVEARSPGEFMAYGGLPILARVLALYPYRSKGEGESEKVEEDGRKGAEASRSERECVNLDKSQNDVKDERSGGASSPPNEYSELHTCWYDIARRVLADPECQKHFTYNRETEAAVAEARSFVQWMEGEPTKKSS